jgi:hypothetical protein
VGDAEAAVVIAAHTQLSGRVVAGSVLELWVIQNRGLEEFRGRQGAIQHGCARAEGYAVQEIAAGDWAMKAEVTISLGFAHPSPWDRLSSILPGRGGSARQPAAFKMVEPRD